MKKILLTLFLIIYTNCFSQINFEKGSFITNADQKVECFIKNIDWKNTPDSFKYRLTENSEILTENISAVKEFQVENQVKYVRKKVKMDRSSNNINDINLGYDRNPTFKEEVVFLKLLVDGNTQLFSYNDETTKKFFYGRNYENIEQLVYKVYFGSQSQIGIRYNTLYKSQLENLFECESFNEKQIQNVEYAEGSLSRIFIKYNKCIDPQAQTQQINTTKKDFFNLSLRPHLNNSSLDLVNTYGNYAIGLDKKITFGLGLEAEFVLPYNKGKWAIILEPTYQYYKAKNTAPNTSISGGTLTADVDYKSVEVPIGLRHYFFLNDNSRIFANISYILDLSLSSEIVVTRADNSVFTQFEPSNRSNIAFGIGYKYKKYCAEFRMQTKRNIIDGLDSWDADYKTVSLIFGYTLF